MADQSQYYKGQLVIVNKLIKDVANRKQILSSFLKAYKAQIDQAYLDKMMMENIENLRSSGFPKYEAQVKNCIRQLDLLDKSLQKAKKSLNTALNSLPKL